MFSTEYPIMFSMDSVAERELRSISKAASELVRHGWARSSSGNISLRSHAIVDIAQKQAFSLDQQLGSKELLQGLPFWISRTGCSMEELSDDPERNAGSYRLIERSLQLLLGSGPPSTEVAVHLLILSGTKNDAIVHCHWDDIGEISKKVKKWSVPEWIGITPPLPPGSIELAKATLKGARDHRLIIWPYHGVISLGNDLEGCIANLKEARNHFESVP